MTCFRMLLGLIGLATAVSAADPKTIVFLAGPKDHGRPGRHEYEKDLRVLAHGLETSPNLGGVTTQVFVGRAPRDLSAFREADAIVIHSSSDRHPDETHPLFPPEPSTDGRRYDEETDAFLKSLDQLIKEEQIGVVVLHYANWAEHWTARGLYLDWLGGLWVQMGSRNPTDEWLMEPQNLDHPILRGVRPWTYRDEVFCRFFLPDDPRRTPLLIGRPATSPVGAQVAAWAYEREDGGRGFVMGGVDFHDNMQLDDYRRFLLNGIAWSARCDVPAKGIVSSLPDAP